ncbi:LegC family aminotransferase [Roseibacterium sp. SDUM158016]|uniref:LegC family aminotransferase n=1 Tax=Roseicyclus sediminis TaxID=2980997 RepID=UPI0021D3D5BE|nr:LegC family aminotransferase [Roseibacterium sp. SDUM158016]MCU4654166.1 LegC family aminotransferase [Roseibacterium sp. SDUM158016]
MAIAVTPADLVADLTARVRAAIGTSDPVPLHAPEFGPRERAMVTDCIDSGWVSSVGSHVDAFEAAVAEACGTEHAVATVNGTSALQIALIVAGVRPGDEVLVPALSFVATANAVCHAGAVPHFLDSSIETLGLCPLALSAHLARVAERTGNGLVNRNTGRRLAAIVPMHVFGHPVDMAALNAVAEDYGLPVVEDAAEALGSLYHDRPCGSLGQIAALSFNGNKILTTGGGGAVITSNGEWARRARHLVTTAKRPHRWAFDHDEVGYNYRLPNLNAALGVAQMEALPDRLARKRRLAGQYTKAFEGCTGATVFGEPAHCRSNHWLNALVLQDGAEVHRDAILDGLNEAGLMVRPVWNLLNRLPMFVDCPAAPLPVASDLERRIVNVPSSANLARP